MPRSPKTRYEALREACGNISELMRETIFLPLEKVVPMYRQRFGPLDFKALPSGSARNLTGLIEQFREFRDLERTRLRVVRVGSRDVNGRSFLMRALTDHEKALAVFHPRVHALVPPGTRLSVVEIHGLIFIAWNDEESKDPAQTSRRMIRKHFDCCQPLNNDEWLIDKVDKVTATRGRAEPARRSRSGSPYSSTRDSRSRSISPYSRRTMSRSRSRGRSSGAPSAVPDAAGLRNARSPVMIDAYNKTMTIVSRHCFTLVKDFLGAFKRRFGVLDFRGLMRSVNKPAEFSDFVRHLGENFPGGLSLFETVDVSGRDAQDWITHDLGAKALNLVQFTDQIHALVLPHTRVSVAQLWELYFQLWQDVEIKSVAELRWKMGREHAACCRHLGDETWIINSIVPDFQIETNGVADNEHGFKFEEMTFEQERQMLLDKPVDPREPRFIIPQAELDKRLANILKLFANVAFVDEDSLLDLHRDLIGEPLRINVFDIPVNHHFNYVRQLSLQFPGRIIFFVSAPLDHNGSRRLVLTRSYASLNDSVDVPTRPFQDVLRHKRIHKLFPRGTVVPKKLLLSLYRRIWDFDGSDDALIAETIEHHRQCCLAHDEGLHILGQQWQTYTGGPPKTRPGPEELAPVIVELPSVKIGQSSSMNGSKSADDDVRHRDRKRHREDRSRDNENHRYERERTRPDSRDRGRSHSRSRSRSRDRKRRRRDHSVDYHDSEQNQRDSRGGFHGRRSPDRGRNRDETRERRKSRDRSPFHPDSRHGLFYDRIAGEQRAPGRGRSSIVVHKKPSISLPLPPDPRDDMLAREGRLPTPAGGGWARPWSPPINEWRRTPPPIVTAKPPSAASVSAPASSPTAPITARTVTGNHSGPNSAQTLQMNGSYLGLPTSSNSPFAIDLSHVVLLARGKLVYEDFDAIMDECVFQRPKPDNV